MLLRSNRLVLKVIKVYNINSRFPYNLNDAQVRYIEIRKREKIDI